MQATLYYLSTIAVMAVAAVLMLGLANLLTGKSANTSQKLMRWRVGLQLVAILVIIAFVLMSQ